MVRAFARSAGAKALSDRVPAAAPGGHAVPHRLGQALVAGDDFLEAFLEQHVESGAQAQTICTGGVPLPQA